MDTESRFLQIFSYKQKPSSPSPKRGVIESHHGHGVFEAMFLLSCHVYNEEGDEWCEGQDQVDGDEGVGEFLHLNRAWLTHHDRRQVHLTPHRTLCLHLYATDEPSQQCPSNYDCE